MLTLLKGCCAGARTLSSCLCWAVGCCGSYKPDIMEFASWYLNLLDIRSCCQGNDGLKLRGTHSPHSECLDCRFYSLLNNTVLKLLQRYWYSNTLLLYTSIWWGAALFLFTFKCKSLHGLGTHCNKHITGWDLKGAFGNVCVCVMCQFQQQFPLLLQFLNPVKVSQLSQAIFRGVVWEIAGRRRARESSTSLQRVLGSPLLLLLLNPGPFSDEKQAALIAKSALGYSPHPTPHILTISVQSSSEQKQR